MKKSLLFLMLLIASNLSNAQTFEEWFNQKKTQKSYLIQQIAALQMYIGFARKGYDIAHQGIETIRDFKDGELNLHGDYFHSLKRVNPLIKKSEKISSIISEQLRIINICNMTYRRLRETKVLSYEELNYIQGVYNRLNADCYDILRQLTLIVQDNQLELQDGDRVKRVDDLHNNIKDKYSFARNFSIEAIQLANFRIRENKEIQNSSTVHGLNH